MGKSCHSPDRSVPKRVQAPAGQAKKIIERKEKFKENDSYSQSRNVKVWRQLTKENGSTMHGSDSPDALEWIEGVGRGEVEVHEGRAAEVPGNKTLLVQLSPPYEYKVQQTSTVVFHLSFSSSPSEV